MSLSKYDFIKCVNLWLSQKCLGSENRSVSLDHNTSSEKVITVNTRTFYRFKVIKWHKNNSLIPLINPEK